MKKSFYLFSLWMVFLVPVTLAKSGHDRSDPSPAKQKIHHRQHHTDIQNSLKFITSEKWNDSLQWYNWNALHSGWDIDVRESRIRSASGYLASRSYIKLDTLTHTWVNMWLDEMEYFGTSGDLQKLSYKTWDVSSASWILYYYEHFASPGHEDEYYYKDWNPVTQKYSYGYRYTYQYDLSNNLTEEIEYDLDTITSLWVNYSKTSSTFSSAGLVEQITSVWDTATSIWKNSQRTVYTYDAGNFLTEKTGYVWISNNWDLSHHSLFTNNPSGLPTLQLDEYWTGTNWFSTYKIMTTYDVAGIHALIRLEQLYNTFTLTWTDSRKETNTYFGNGLPSSVLSELMNTVSSEWISWKFDEYDESGNTIDSYFKSIDTYTFDVLYGSRYLDTYDVNSRFLQEIKQNFDTATGLWVDYSMMQDTYEDPVNTYVTEELGTLWDGSSWVNDYKDIFFWSYPSGIDPHQGGERLCFHENPMTPGKPINCPFLEPLKEYRFDLFSMKGESVFSETITGNSSFVISRSLAAGNYLLRITEKGKTVYRDKVVIL
ncbi:MAG: T9SS type A sorting domain-containing protein [Bacteroidetes bacterium]|nr:T9SS type A sorting domain-containing protein [Bacteroidota bacterium]